MLADRRRRSAVPALRRLCLACLAAGIALSPASAQTTLFRDTSGPFTAHPAPVVAGAIGPQITCFFADAAAQAAAAPSFALKDPRPDLTPLAATPALQPTFGTINKRTAVSISVPAGTSLYGLGSSSGPLRRNGRSQLLWNYDNYGYDDNAINLYQAHPWILGVRSDGSAFGIILDTTYRLSLTLPTLTAAAGSIIAISDGPAFPVITIERPHPAEIMKALGQLTGTIELPPLWALGFHQCRFSYNPEARVREIADGFRSRKIPADVIWLDIDYMDKFRTFTFDRAQFPDPKRLNDYLKSLGFHNIWMINPGVAADPAKFPPGGYPIFEQLMKGDHATQKADGTTYFGEVWPGKCVFPDFTRAATRAWWATLYKPFMAQGIDGVWNDMNEPAVFNTPDPQLKTMPDSNLHRADPELGGPGSHLRYHNVYGMLMVKASREGILAANPDKRPFVLSRANFLGGHRYAAMWTGDNLANWYHLDISVAMSINMGLSGQPFAGPDIGGFSGNGPGGQEGLLYERWIGFGALLPFARAHTGKGAIDKEPWSFGPEVEQTARDAIGRRYRLMPYFYTLFREASVTGLPVIRPLFFLDPKDPTLRTEDDAFLLGDSLLVVPQMVPDLSRVPTLPTDIARWARFDFSADSARSRLLTADGAPLSEPAVDAPEEPDEDLPTLYLRPGSIIPVGPLMQFTGEKPLDPLTLYVNLDDSGRATGTLYEDAGDGFAYRTGDYRLTTFSAQREGDTVRITVTNTEGNRPAPPRTLRVRVLKP